MTRRLHNPELDRLVSEMNRLGELAQRDELPETDDALPELDAPSLREVQTGEPLERLLAEMVRRGASDLLLVPGSPPVLRIDGNLEAMDEGPVDGDAVRMILTPHLGPRSRRNLDEHGSADFSLRLSEPSLSDGDGGWRLRVSLQRQRGSLSAAVRALPRIIPSPAELGLPEALAELVKARQGLILVCGPTGCGKTTTLASLLDVVNRSEMRHVITIEDPVEYEHTSSHSVVEQVEVGRDAPSFKLALRAALRRDPDVILVGEMRDLETMATAVTAAETGHLILSTLHTGDVTQAVHRIIDVFPATQQAQIRHQLALSLHAIVCQQLVPRADGAGRVAAVELLVATNAIRNHIRHGRIERLYNEVQVGRTRGMQSIELALAGLAGRGLITEDEARRRAVRPDELERMLGG
jgi:twitching motility protein PilT